MGRKLSIEESKVNIDSLITAAKASCARIKEIDDCIGRLQKKIAEVGQHNPKVAYYEYTCSEFEEEKSRIANSFRVSFKEISEYNEELKENYERLQKSVEIQQIMNRYVARALKDDSHSFSLFKRKRSHANVDEDFQKMLKERDDIALKMEQTSPIVDTIKLLLAEIDEKCHMQTVR